MRSRNLSRGPFAAIGSFKICTKIFGFPPKNLVYLSGFYNLRFYFKLAKIQPGFTFIIECVMDVNFSNDLAYGLRSV